jgi:hypothetical protein
MTQGLRHKFSHHRFKDRESLGHIPVCTEQGLSPRRQTFTSLILAYKKQRGKKKSLFNTKKKKKKNQGSSVTIIMKAITVWRSKLPSSHR